MQADRSATEAMDAWLAGLDEPFEGTPFPALAGALPDGSTLWAGNSMPVRDMDGWLPSTDRAITVRGNRGANGIDGVVSTALGSAAVAPGPVALVVGDVSFLHDLNALVAARLHGLSATIVLVNNDGGGIFSFLPQGTASIPGGGLPEQYGRLFGTPHGIEVAPIVTALGGEHARWSDTPSCARGVEASIGRPGVRVLGAADGSRPERRAPSGRRGRGRAGRSGDDADPRPTASTTRSGPAAGGRPSCCSHGFTGPGRRLEPACPRSAPRGPPSPSTCSVMAARTGPVIRLGMPSNASAADLAGIAPAGSGCRPPPSSGTRSAPASASSSCSTTPTRCRRCSSRVPRRASTSRTRAPAAASEDNDLADRIERDGIEAFVDSWWETTAVFASERTLSAATRARFRAGRLRNGVDGLANSLRGAGQGAMTPLGTRLPSVAVPTLVLAGQLDPTGARRARAIAAAIPNARLEVMDGVGHAAHRESPSRFRRLALDFLQEDAA